MRNLYNWEGFNESEKYGIENYTINEDGSIDVNDDVNLKNINLKRLPL